MLSPIAEQNLHPTMQPHTFRTGEHATRAPSLLVAILAALLVLPIALLFDPPSAVASLSHPASIAVSVVAPSAGCISGVYTVTSVLDDGSVGTLRDAIASICPTINFNLPNPSTIVVTGTEYMNSNKTINGPGQAALAINGNNAVQILSIGFVSVTISNLTFKNGRSATFGGGAILAQDCPSWVTLSNVAFISNTASSGQSGGAIAIDGNIMYFSIDAGTFMSNTGTAGGAIFIDGGAVTVTNSSFVSNTASSSGGGVAAAAAYPNASLFISASTFTSNVSSSGNGGAVSTNISMTIGASSFVFNQASSGSGGAIYSTGAALTVSGSTLTSNHAAHDGGGIFADNVATVTNTSFTGNGASNDGGGIHNSGTFNVTNSTFLGNGGFFGGGIGNYGTAYVTNSTFSGNSGNGGAIHDANTLNLTNSTLYGNNGSSYAGGLYTTGNATPVNSIIANNSVANCTANAGGTLNNGGNNLEDGASCGWGTSSGSQSNTNPRLGPLANNGGSTQTFALLPGSPAINAVTYNAPNGCPTTDQRGAHRPIGSYCDIGAYEAGYLYLPLILK